MTTTRRVVLSLLAILACLGLGYGGFKLLAAQKAPPAAADTTKTLVRVSTLKLSLQDFQETFSGYGRARALKEVQVSAEVSGRVLEMAQGLEVGAVVESQQILFQLDDTDYLRAQERAQAQLDQLEADLKWKQGQVESLDQQLVILQRELEISRGEFERTKKLNLEGTESDRSFDAQRIAVAVTERSAVKMINDLNLAKIDNRRAEAAVAAAKVDLQQAEYDLKRCVIRAPMSGRLLSRQVEIGARVAAGRLLAEITDPDQVEVAIAIPARLRDAIAVGCDIKLRLAAEGAAIPTEIVRLAPTINSAERSFLAFAELTSSPERLAPAPGTFFHAEVNLPSRDAVYVIPRTAMLGAAVFVADRGENDQATLRAQVFAVESLLPDVLISRDPLAAGAEIVIDNLEQIANGSLVQIVRVEAGSDQ